jgi:membrane associated rhomboid family serine protease
MSSQPDVYLCETESPEVVTAVRHALTDAGIPYRTGLLADETGSATFFVGWHKLEQARRIVKPFIDDTPDFDDLERDASYDRRRPTTTTRFPWEPVQAVASVILLHFALVFWVGGSLLSGRWALQHLSILGGHTLDEPWRLVTAMFLHVDLRHAFGNGVSMLVFAVPVMQQLGLRRTGWIYFGSGIVGGLSALALTTPGTLTLGSSGAVAGLFGAWVVLTYTRRRGNELSWRTRVQSLGIALLVLPSLLSPVSASGHSISVPSHLGGLITGAIAGSLISRGMFRHEDALALVRADRSLREYPN